MKIQRQKSKIQKFFLIFVRKSRFLPKARFLLLTSYFLLLFLISLYLNIFISPVFAQPPHAVSPPATHPALPEVLRQKIKEATKPGEVRKEAVKRVLKSRAYSGVVKSISENSVFVASKNGSRQIKVTDETQVFKMPVREKIGFSELKVGDFVVGMGEVDAVGVMTAKVVLQTPAKKPELRRHAVHGIVQSIAGQSLVLKHPKRDKPYPVQVTSLTKIKIKGLEFPSFSDIKVGDRVVATGTIENEVLTAKHLFVIPASPAGGPGKTSGLEKPTTPTRLPKLSTPAASE